MGTATIEQLISHVPASLCVSRTERLSYIYIFICLGGGGGGVLWFVLCTGTISPQLGKLKALMEIDFAGNCLSGKLVLLMPCRVEWTP